MRLITNGLDVWGNAEDGFDVNDVLGSHGTITVKSLDDDHIIARLVEEDIIHKGNYKIEVFGCEEDFYHAYLLSCDDERPLLQLKQVSP